MRLVLDAGGLSALTGRRARLDALRRRGAWPPLVPSVVLTEALTGDHRRDFHVNRLLRTCQIRDVDELSARSAVRLRYATGRAGTISATDAIVAAVADSMVPSTVLTSDRADMLALAEVAGWRFTVAAV